MNEISCFRGKYAFLSNFWTCPTVYCGVVFPTLEHAFQAAKLPDDFWHLHEDVFHLSPAEAKRWGRRIPLRDDWDQIDRASMLPVKEAIMLDLLRQKYKPGRFLARQLLETGDAELIERTRFPNPYWGVGPDGVGENRQGGLTMRVRDELSERYRR